MNDGRRLIKQGIKRELLDVYESVIRKRIDYKLRVYLTNGKLNKKLTTTSSTKID